MKVPKKIEKLLNRRTRLAEQLSIVSAEIDKWLEGHGADFTDNDIEPFVLTGAGIYCEPYNSEQVVLRYIKEKL